MALRCYMFFDGTNRRENYLNVSSQLYFTFTPGDKPSFQAPSWYFPAGGGVWGFDATSGDSIFCNGEPTQEAICKLARPIMLPVRQSFSVTAQFFAVGSTDALTNLNAGDSTDIKVIQFLLDGLQTRDVE